MKQILLLEDDSTLCQGIALALQSAEQQITQCHTIKEAKLRLTERNFDLGIFDINLPDGSGLTLLQEVKKDKNLPIILLTAKDTEMDIVLGLESGADDYIAKPFSLAVLRARVNLQLRRSDAMQEESKAYAVFEQDGFVFDFAHMEFRKDGQLLEFSKTEQKLLRHLITNRGITVTRERLLQVVWPDGAEYVDENALSVSMKRLRDKLEDIPSKPQYIKTIYGVGYQWVKEG